MKPIYKGIAIMLCSSFCTCLGQLCWKISSLQMPLFYMLIGFFLYGCGALLMITALRYGELSILHPMLSAGYVLSILLGSAVLKETITITKVLGIGVIIFGLILLSASSETEEKE